MVYFLHYGKNSLRSVIYQYFYEKIFFVHELSTKSRFINDTCKKKVTNCPIKWFEIDTKPESKTSFFCSGLKKIKIYLGRIYP
jgi:hypothetical protein